MVEQDGPDYLGADGLRFDMVSALAAAVRVLGAAKTESVLEGIVLAGRWWNRKADPLDLEAIRRAVLDQDVKLSQYPDRMESPCSKHRKFLLRLVDEQAKLIAELEGKLLSKKRS